MANTTDEETLSTDLQSSIYTSWYISTGLFILAFVIHSTGLIVINLHKKRSRTKLCNQTLIICNLCIIEMMCILYNIIHDAIISTNFETYNQVSMPLKDLHDKIYDFGDTGNKVHEAIYYGLANQVIFTMFILTLDRLTSIFFVLKYKIYVTKRILLNIIIASWITSIILGALSVPSLSFVTLISMIIASCYILIAIISYILIIVKMQMYSDKSIVKTTTTIVRPKTFLVPGMIIFTFIVSYVTVFLVKFVIHSKESITRRQFLVYESINMIKAIGFATDPLIYIFLTKKYRDMVVNIFYSHDSAVEHSEMTPDRVQSSAIAVI